MSWNCDDDMTTWNRCSLWWHQLVKHNQRKLEICFQSKYKTVFSILTFKTPLPWSLKQPGATDMSSYKFPIKSLCFSMQQKQELVFRSQKWCMGVLYSARLYLLCYTIIHMNITYIICSQHDLYLAPDTSFLQRHNNWLFLTLIIS